MIEPFLLRALLAAIGLGLVAAPLGCVIVWNRMAYLGETVAQASLIGVAIGLALEVDPTLSVVLVALAAAALILALGRQKVLPIDSILGLMHHGALAAGVIATALLAGPSVDLMGYLFGDIFAVTSRDLVLVYAGGLAVLVALSLLWPSLVRIAVHEELAAAEGVPTQRVRTLFLLLLAVTIAVAIKVVGVLLVIAFLIVPAVAARPLAATPERMALSAALVAVAGSTLGLGLSWRLDAPGGPSIVLVLALVATVSLLASQWRRS
jgi:zinc transport system permease protein